MFYCKRILYFTFLFLCLHTLFSTAIAEEKNSKVVINEKLTCKKEKKRKRDVPNTCNHDHSHDHKSIEVNLEQKLTAIYMYKILNNYAIWNEKNIENGLKIAVVGDYNQELLEKLNLLSTELILSNSKLPFVVEIWNENLDISDYHAIFIGDTDTPLFQSIIQIAHQNAIITFSSLKNDKMSMLETTVQFMVINNKLKFSLAQESVGKLIQEDLWKKSHKL
ncbi:MAG: YfiR/HmsC family protein [Chitinophagales bacterium]